MVVYCKTVNELEVHFETNKLRTFLRKSSLESHTGRALTKLIVVTNDDFRQIMGLPAGPGSHCPVENVGDLLRVYDVDHIIPYNGETEEGEDALSNYIWLNSHINRSLGKASPSSGAKSKLLENIPGCVSVCSGSNTTAHVHPIAFLRRASVVSHMHS